MNYDKKKMKEELTKLSSKLEASEKLQIAFEEQCATSTIYTYLNGNIAVCALAKSIIERGNTIIKSRKKQSA